MMPPRNSNGKFAPPPPGSRSEQTGEQAPQRGRIQHIPPFMEGALTLGLLLQANGVNPQIASQNPMGFPGYEYMYTGNYPTYRWILQFSIVRLVRSIRMGMIAANTWDVVPADEGDVVPKELLVWERKTFRKIRQELIWDIMARGHDMGWACGEPIWRYEDGRYRLFRVKPLLQDVSEVLVDDGGNPVGIRNNVSRGQNSTGPVELGMPFKAFHFAYDSEGGYVYGRSWLENIRSTSWRSYLDTIQQLQKLGSKISGTVTIITSPAGTFPGPPDATTGKPTTVSFRENAVQVIKDLANGAAGAWFPSLGLSPDGKGGLDALKVMAQLIGKSLTSVDVKDFSGNATGITGLVEKMKHEEELIFAGGLRPSRTGMEAEHGSRADAGEHTNTGTFNAEGDEEEFVSKLQPLLDADIMMNFGPKYVGKTRVKATSLVDRKTAIYKAMLLGLINDPEVAAGLAEIPGMMDALLTVLDVASGGHFDVEEFKRRKKESAAAKVKSPKTPEPQGGRPPAGAKRG